MQIQKRTLGWLPKPSLYNEQAAKAAKQRASHKAFLGSQSNLQGSVSDIMNTKAVETTNLVSKVALARIQNKTA
ncbi:MAG: hypothetical protein EOP22_17090 [Hyphomicrobiales bacterium]|nr:MAG: hypothetical protein EOP22_17090 [Hyphomicrobiales bacterium]